MYINFIDKNGNEETVFNIYTEEFKKKAFSKQSKLNEIEILICESKIYKKENIIPEHLYSKAISIINGRDDKYYAKQCEGLKARLNAINLLTPELEKQSKAKKQQLTKAKDLLLRFIELKNKPCAVGHSVNMLLYENICAEAKQFLKETE